MLPDQATIVLLSAAFFDYLIGDPWHWPHPVQIMGLIIAWLTQSLLKRFHQPWQRKLIGVVLGGGVVIGSGGVVWLMIMLTDKLHWLGGLLLQIVLLASCFAGHSLSLAALDVLQPLEKDDIEAARVQLSRYVGRDTHHLSKAEIYRATLETVAENAVDGVTAPLFYAIAGALIPIIGPVPMAIAYKAASTLDSMIGYHREPYRDIGCFSARFEDCLTWLPCRLTVLTLACFSLQPKQVLSVCFRDAPQDPSPNSGWSECIYAAVLGVQLGGSNTYQGIVKEKPQLGNPLRPIGKEIIRRSLHLTRRCFLLWLIIGSIILNISQLSIIAGVLLL